MDPDVSNAQGDPENGPGCSTRWQGGGKEEDFLKGVTSEGDGLKDVKVCIGRVRSVKRGKMF